MKVALVNLGRKGGGPVYSIEIAKTIKEKVDLMCIISKQVENLDKWRELGVQLIEIDTYHDMKSLFFSTLNIRKFWLLRQTILAWKPDVVYIPMMHTWTVLINYLLKKVPIVLTVHDPNPHMGEESVLTTMTNSIAYSQAKRVIILSNAFRDHMEQRNIPSSSIDVIPHGEFSYYIDKSIETPKSFHNTILFFGRISKYKGIEVLLKAFEIIKKLSPETKLMIVGNGDMSPYGDLIGTLHDVEIVNKWIPDEEVGSFFALADFVVTPYIDASQSGVIPLAYSAGLPVVASDTGGLSEQVRDRVTGFLVKPGDAEALAEKCLYLISNRDLVLQMGRNAHEMAKNDLSWDRVGELLVESFIQAQK